VTLATPNEYKELTTFFSLYRGTADRQELVAATVSVAEAILKVGGSTGSKVIQRAASDPLTLPEVRRELVDLTAG